MAAQVCARPLPADEQSIVGRLPGAEWLYVAVTHSGVTLAAHLSRLIAAELAAGRARCPTDRRRAQRRLAYRPYCFAGRLYVLPALLPEVIGRGLLAPDVRRDSRLAG